MAFTFANPGSTSPFGAASSPAPAFGTAPPSPFGATTQAAAPAFGATSTPAFSFSSSATPAFGQSAPAAFGATSAPAAFGAASSPSLFGASSTPSLFGGSSTPAFGQSAAGTSFSFASAPATGSAFGTSAPAPGASSIFPSFGTNPLQLPGQQPQQQQQQQAGTLITYSTKYDELPADRQKELQDIQREISSYREDCEKLERDQRLHDSVALKKTLDDETSGLKQGLQAMQNAVRVDDDAMADFREKVLRLLRATEHTVRTFQRSKLWREAPTTYKGQMIPPSVQEVLASPVLLPSPYLEQAVAGFREALASYRTVVGELEQALPPGAARGLHPLLGGAGDGSSVLQGMSEPELAQSLPLIISNMHDYLVHVAAHMERLHYQVQRAKSSFLEARRAEGDMGDPFQEARRSSLLEQQSSGRLTVVPPASHHHQGAQGGHHAMGQGQAGAQGHGLQAPGALGFGAPGTAMPGAASPFAPAGFGAPLGTPVGGDMSRQASKGGASGRRRGK